MSGIVENPPFLKGPYCPISSALHVIRNVARVSSIDLSLLMEQPEIALMTSA